MNARRMMAAASCSKENSLVNFRKDDDNFYLQPQGTPATYIWKKKAAMKESVEMSENMAVVDNDELTPSESSRSSSDGENKNSQSFPTSDCRPQLFAGVVNNASDGEEISHKLIQTGRISRNTINQRNGTQVNLIANRYEIDDIHEVSDLNQVEFSDSDVDNISEDSLSPRAPIADVSCELLSSGEEWCAVKYAEADDDDEHNDSDSSYSYADNDSNDTTGAGRRQGTSVVYANGDEELENEHVERRMLVAKQDLDDRNEDKYEAVRDDEEELKRRNNQGEKTAGTEMAVLILEGELEENVASANECLFNPWSDRDLSDVEEEDEAAYDEEEERRTNEDLDGDSDELEFLSPSGSIADYSEEDYVKEVSEYVSIEMGNETRQRDYSHNETRIGVGILATSPSMRPKSDVDTDSGCDVQLPVLKDDDDDDGVDDDADHPANECRTPDTAAVVSGYGGLNECVMRAASIGRNNGEDEHDAQIRAGSFSPAFNRGVVNETEIHMGLMLRTGSDAKFSMCNDPLSGGASRIVGLRASKILHDSCEEASSKLLDGRALLNSHNNETEDEEAVVAAHVIRHGNESDGSSQDMNSDGINVANEHGDDVDMSDKKSRQSCYTSALLTEDEIPFIDDDDVSTAECSRSETDSDSDATAPVDRGEMSSYRSRYSRCHIHDLEPTSPSSTSPGNKCTPEHDVERPGAAIETSLNQSELIYSAMEVKSKAISDSLTKLYEYDWENLQEQACVGGKNTSWHNLNKLLLYPVCRCYRASGCLHLHLSREREAAWTDERKRDDKVADGDGILTQKRGGTTAEVCTTKGDGTFGESASVCDVEGASEPGSHGDDGERRVARACAVERGASPLCSAEARRRHNSSCEASLGDSSTAVARELVTGDSGVKDAVSDAEARGTRVDCLNESVTLGPAEVLLNCNGVSVNGASPCGETGVSIVTRDHLTGSDKGVGGNSLSSCTIHEDHSIELFTGRLATAAQPLGDKQNVNVLSVPVDTLSDVKPRGESGDSERNSLCDSDVGKVIRRRSLDRQKIDEKYRNTFEYGPRLHRTDSSRSNLGASDASRNLGCGFESVVSVDHSSSRQVGNTLFGSQTADQASISPEESQVNKEVNYVAILADISKSFLELESSIDKNLKSSTANDELSILSRIASIKSADAAKKDNSTSRFSDNNNGELNLISDQDSISQPPRDNAFINESSSLKSTAFLNNLLANQTNPRERSISSRNFNNLPRSLFKDIPITASKLSCNDLSIPVREVEDKSINNNQENHIDLCDTRLGISSTTTSTRAPSSIGCNCSTGEVHGSSDNLVLPPLNYNKDARLTNDPRFSNQCSNSICNNLRVILDANGRCSDGGVIERDECGDGGGCRRFDVFGDGLEERLSGLNPVQAIANDTWTPRHDLNNGHCEIVWNTARELQGGGGCETYFGSFPDEHGNANWGQGVVVSEFAPSFVDGIPNSFAMRQKHKTSSSGETDEDKPSNSDRKLVNGTSEKVVVVKQNGQITKSILKTLPKRANAKKSKKEPIRKKNRVIFNESLNTSIDADYVILVREEDEYDYECSDEITCTCNLRPVEREMVRIDRNGGGQFELNMGDQCSAFEPPMEFVDQVTLSPPEGYKDGNSHFYYHQPSRSICSKSSPAEEVHGEESGSESSLDARSEDDEVSSPGTDHASRKHPDQRRATRSLNDDASMVDGDENQSDMQLDNNQMQLTDADDPKSQQRYIVETITMTTVTERRIVREADDAMKRDGDKSHLPSGILKGGKQWKSDKVKAEHEEVTSFGSPGTPDDGDSFEKRGVRFTRDSEGTQTDDNEEEEDENDSCSEQDADKVEQPSPDSTELMLTFKLGNHVLVANSLNPNSAVRQLFPAQRFPSPNQKLPVDPDDPDQDGGDINKSTPQQYLVTAESLKLFEESKRARVANYYNNQENNISNSVTGEDDVPVNTNLIKRTIERNTLRRSLLRYEPGRHRRCMKRNDENSLVERIKQLTCDVEEPTYDYGEVMERSSPTGEESKPSQVYPDTPPKPTLPSPSEVAGNGARLSPSSSSSSGSTASTYKKLTDLFARRNEKSPQEQQQMDQMNMQQEYLVNADYGNTVYLSPPDLGNGLPLHVVPPKDFGAQTNFVSPKIAMTKTSVTSEARKQFLSTLAPLTACVGAGIGNGGEDGDYYHVSPGMLPHNLRQGDRTSVASTNTESGYSLNDIDEALEDENSQPQPDLVAGTQTSQTVDGRPPIPAKNVTTKAHAAAAKINAAVSASKQTGKVAGGQGNAQKVAGNATTAVQGGGPKLGPKVQGAAARVPVGAASQEPTDELALFVQQDAGRIERIKKRYSLNSSPNNSDDENDDYGFNRRPSVRGIKPRFGSTEEIIQQMQSQMQPPAGARVGTHMSWPYQVESPPRKALPVRSPQMPCVQEENVVYYGNYNGNNGPNQNYVAQAGCQAHQTICNHHTVGCLQNQLQTETDAMGRKYVSNSVIYASTGNLYENQNQIMRIGGGCGDAQVYGSLGVRYLHHQTHLQHPGTSNSPPPPGVPREFPAYNEALPPCMHQDPRFAAELQQACQHQKGRRFSGELVAIAPKEPIYSGENVANKNEVRYSGEGFPPAMPNCNHLERYAELALTTADPRYYQDVNTNQRYAGVGEGQYSDSNALYQDPRTTGIQSLDRSFAGRRPPNVTHMRVSPTSATQTQPPYQGNVRAPFQDPTLNAIVDPHYSSYRPPNPQIRVNVGPAQTIKLPYGSTPVQVHLMARGVRSESPQRCGSPVGAAQMARGTQTMTQQSYQGRGYYGQVAGDHAVSAATETPAEISYQEMQDGSQSITDQTQNQTTADDKVRTQQAVENQNQMQRHQQMMNVQRSSFQGQPNVSPTKYSNERGVPEGAASVPASFPQDSSSATSPTDSISQGAVSSVPGVYYAMNV